MIELNYTVPGGDDLRVHWNWYDDYVMQSSTDKGAHIHSYYEIYIYISGDVAFMVGENLYQLQRGDIIFTKPNQRHHCIYYHDTVHEHFCLHIHGKLSGIIPESGLIRLPAQERNLMLMLCYRFNKKIGENPSVFFQSATLNMLLSMISEAKIKPELSVDFSARMKPILSYMNASYHEIDTIEGLAEKFFISQSTLERMFRNEIGITPYKYLEEIRMSVACSCLQKGHSVTEACMQCGYGDCSQFISKFKKRFGITPFRYSKKRKYE